jgi:hypothetical protein
MGQHFVLLSLSESRGLNEHRRVMYILTNLLSFQQLTKHWDLKRYTLSLQKYTDNPGFLSNEDVNNVCCKA